MVCVRSTYSGNRLSIAQALNIARNAGFQGLSAYVFVAVEMAESSLDVGAVCYDSNGTRDEGIAQISSTHGFGGSFDPAQAAAFSYGLSNNGTDFSPWGGYTSGNYQAFLPQVISGDANSDVSAGIQYVCQSDTNPSDIVKTDASGNCPSGYTKQVFIKNPGATAASGLFPHGVGGTSFGGGALEPDWLKAIIDRIQSILEFVTTPKSWLRIGAAVIGIGLILIGGYKLLSTGGGAPKPANIRSPSGRPAFSYLDVKDPNA